jgi:hypothetical protein
MPAATVTIDFAAETAKFNAGLKEVNSRLKNLEGGFASVTNIAKGFLGGLSIAAIGNFIKSSAAAADALGKTADRLGESTEGLKAFQLAATGAGVDLGTANKILSESQKRLGDAAGGSGEAAKFIKLLGLNIKDLQTKSPVELFETYSEAIGQLSTRSEQVAAASALMGKAAAESFGFISQGAGAVSDAATFVDKYALALNRVDTAKIELAGDAVARLQTYSEAAGARIAAGLSPFVTALADDLLGASDSTLVFQERAEQFGAVAYTAFQIVANAARTLQAAFYGIAAAGAKVLSFVTWGDVSESFQASVDENLRKADEALGKVKSIEEIQARIINALEKSRDDAAAAAAKGKDIKTGTLTIAPESDAVFDNATLFANVQKTLADEVAAHNKQVESEVTAHFLEELRIRELQARAAAGGRNAFTDAEAEAEQKAQASIKQARNDALNSGMDALQAYAGESKKSAKALVVINKARALANAVMNTYEAATNQLKGGDPYTAVARAAIVVAFGMAQVAAIMKTGYGEVSAINASSSGGAPIGSPSNPVYTQPQSDDRKAGGGESTLQVTINGNFFGSRETVDYLMEQFREEINNRDVVLFSSSSRQAQELSAP